MMLSCKVGTFNSLLDELIKLNLSKKEIHLLFGPVDIFVQFDELKDCDEFINKWFDTIRRLTPQEPMVEKIQPLIVVSKGKLLTEEPFAFLFMNTQPRNLERVQKELECFPQVLSADTTLGSYELVCAVKASNNQDLIKLVAKIQEAVPHIQGTVTAIVSSLY